MGGVRVTFLQAEPIIAELRERASELLKCDDRVLEVSLFGSLVSGRYAPGSDADLLVVLKHDSRRFIDRIPEFLERFSGLGIAVDVFPYTVEEIEGMKDVGLVKAALKERVVLARRQLGQTGLTGSTGSTSKP